MREQRQRLPALLGVHLGLALALGAVGLTALCLRLGLWLGLTRHGGEIAGAAAGGNIYGRITDAAEKVASPPGIEPGFSP
jgi:hypothetical protein